MYLFMSTVLSCCYKFISESCNIYQNASIDMRLLFSKIKNVFTLVSISEGFANFGFGLVGTKLDYQLVLR